MIKQRCLLNDHVLNIACLKDVSVHGKQEELDSSRALFPTAGSGSAFHRPGRARSTCSFRIWQRDGKQTAVRSQPVSLFPLKLTCCMQVAATYAYRLHVLSLQQICSEHARLRGSFVFLTLIGAVLF